MPNDKPPYLNIKYNKFAYIPIVNNIVVFNTSK